MGGPADPGRAQGDRLPVPGNHQAGIGLRAPHPQGQAARHRDRLHPGVRGRALVGAPAAQPVRAAAQGTVAVHPGCDGDLGALAAVLLRRAGRTHPAARRPDAVGAGPDAGIDDPAGRCQRQRRLDPRPPGRGMTDPGAAVTSADELAPGVEVEVDIGAVAHGGHCVARYDGRVIFVRLGLPGERAVVRITEAKRGSFCRGEVIEVLRADPRRVAPPCTHFHPGGCGGCDFQHADAGLQRELKAAVIAEQLSRLAGIDWPVEVEPLPGSGFGWRSRVRWALDPEGRIGPRGVRSHRVEGVNRTEPCLIAVPELTELAGAVDVPAGVRGTPRARRTRGAERRPAGGRGSNRTEGVLPEVALCRSAAGRTTATWIGLPSSVITERAVGRDFSVAADGFWQPHVDAAEVLAQAVQQALDGFELTGSSAWDLYGGVGLFAEVLCRLVGP